LGTLELLSYDFVKRVLTLNSWVLFLFFSFWLTGCVEPYAYREHGYPAYSYGRGYVAPILPPPGVGYVTPRYPAPGADWGWAYHPEYGYGWHHEKYGWRHGDRD
jgi:hypothetical protein